MQRSWLIIAAIAGFTAVLLGAFGAHALGDRLDADMLSVYRTGSIYHLVHAPVLLLVALLLERHEGSRVLLFSAWSFSLGIILFSGSLYLLAGTGISAFGAVTPLGGVAFLAGWLGIFLNAIRSH